MQIDTHTSYTAYNIIEKHFIGFVGLLSVFVCQNIIRMFTVFKEGTYTIWHRLFLYLHNLTRTLFVPTEYFLNAITNETRRLYYYDDTTACLVFEFTSPEKRRLCIKQTTYSLLFELRIYKMFLKSVLTKRNILIKHYKR